MRKLVILRPIALGALASACLVSPGLAASFTPLGAFTPGSDTSQANGVAADGSVVIGARRNEVAGTEGFRWTSAGLVGLGDLPGYLVRSTAFGVSADGAVVVGSSFSENVIDSIPRQGEEAFRWTAGGGIVGLGYLPGGFYTAAFATSADGSVVVGEGYSMNNPPGSDTREAFRWTTGGGYELLGDLSGGPGSPLDGDFNSIAWDVSGDGAVVVGGGTSVSGREAFRWTEGGGLVGLGDLDGGLFSSVARAVSADGSVIVGSGTIGTVDEPVTKAVRWTGGGPLQLDNEDFSSVALDVSADGSVIVGYAFFTGPPEAFVWTEAGGLRRLYDVLVEDGATGLTDEFDQPIWTLSEARGISADGRTLVGVGLNPDGNAEAFVASISLPDLAPDPFFFLDQTGVAQSSAITAAPVTITGITGSAPVTVANGQYSVGCTGTFVSTPGTATNNDTVCVRHTSAAAPSTSTDTTLTVGGVADTFSSTTASSGGGGGGGGALDGFSLLALGVLGVMRRKLAS